MHGNFDNVANHEVSAYIPQSHNDESAETCYASEKDENYGVD